VYIILEHVDSPRFRKLIKRPLIPSMMVAVAEKGEGWKKILENSIKISLYRAPAAWSSYSLFHTDMLFSCA
jgi:hypothetical protein